MSRIIVDKKMVLILRGTALVFINQVMNSSFLTQRNGMFSPCLPPATRPSAVLSDNSRQRQCLLRAKDSGQCEIPSAHVSSAILGSTNCPFCPLRLPGYGEQNRPLREYPIALLILEISFWTGIKQVPELIGECTYGR